MILVDTSVWVEHLKTGRGPLGALLEEGRVLTHEFVIGELACGQLARRAELLTLLRDLPAAPPAAHEEVLALVEQHRLAGSGIGWVDAHLLASTLLAGSMLLTLDRPLRAIASRLGLAF